MVVNGIRRYTPQDVAANINDPLERLADRLAVKESINATWPLDGTLGLYPAGTTTFDFVNGLIDGPKGRESMAIPSDVLRQLQAFTFFIDAPSSVELRPGYGKFYNSPVQVVQASERDLHSARVTSVVPYIILISMSSGPFAPDVSFIALSTQRRTATVLTKTAIAGTSDTLAALNFVPYYGTTYLNQASFGNKWLATDSYGQKSFLIRNLSTTNAVEVQLVGAMDINTAITYGWVNDPDNPNKLTIAANGTAEIETDAGWSWMEVTAAVATAAAAGQTATIVVEYKSLAPGVRGGTGGGGSAPGSADVKTVTATGAGAISLATTASTVFRFIRAEVHLSAKPTSSGDATLTINPSIGSAYNTVLNRVDPSTGLQGTDIVFTGDANQDFASGDQVTIAYPNTDGLTYHARLVWEENP